MIKTELKEKPILFSAPMVKALLAGRKTQTRRVMINPPDGMDNCYLKDFKKDFGGRECPYGQVGDRLWVRETFRHYGNCFNAGNFTAFLTYKVDNNDRTIDYGATEPPKQTWWNKGKSDIWQPGIFMYREFSRITLEVTEIRAPRLQEISEADARAEGVFSFDFTSKVEFSMLWDEINGKKHPWASNPWVWAISFKVVSHA